MMILRLTVEKKWFDKIARGEKPIDYRLYKFYWMDRLIYKNSFVMFDEIRITNGYGNDRPFLRAEHLKTELIMDGRKTDLKVARPVFGIHLGKILEIGNWKENKIIRKPIAPATRIEV